MMLARAMDVSRRYGDLLTLDGGLAGRAGRLDDRAARPERRRKSTLVSLFTGLRKPAAGTVELCGGRRFS